MMRANEVKEMENKLTKIIHTARILGEGGRVIYLLLRQTGDQSYRWFEFQGDKPEIETVIESPTVEEAFLLARKHWRTRSFRMVNCGFRYTLPERDEHGLNALFHQMVASYSASNGVYFDTDLGNNCIVNFASDEARNLWKTFKQANKL